MMDPAVVVLGCIITDVIEHQLAQLICKLSLPHYYASDTILSLHTSLLLVSTRENEVLA